MNEKQAEILKILSQYLKASSDQRFGQALLNLSVNQFYTPLCEDATQILLRDIYNDSDEEILERMKRSTSISYVEQYTVLACNPNEIKSIEPLLKRFSNQSKLYFCTGPEKVGKTIFSLKLLHGLLKTKLVISKPVTVAFDDTTQYWEKHANQNIQFFHPFKKRDQIMPEDIVDFLKSKKFAKTQMIVLDGLDKYFALWMEAPIKLTTSGRGKLTTCFAGEDLVVQVCQG